MLELDIQAWHLPKAGNRWEECEDACAYRTRTKRLAVADGASDAFEARLWAKALVRAFVKRPPDPSTESLIGWLEAPIQTWTQGIRWDQLAWYAEEKARRGAFATLLGVVFAPPETSSSGSWQAIAVGDTCLFHVRQDRMIAGFPVEEAAAFGNTPVLLSTRPDYNRRSLEELKTMSGDCQAGDGFILATDALAAWFLRQVEGGERPWRQVHGLTSGKFARLVQRLRQEAVMRNDDVTLLRVSVVET
jgi:hypothetical protein